MIQTLLTLNHLTKYYGDKLILNEISLIINRTDRLALVGENGVGKTTLVRILMGEETADQGTIQFAPDLEIGYLPQQLPPMRGVTMQLYLEQTLGRLDLIAAEMRVLEDKMAANAFAEADLAHYGQLQELFERKGGYELEYQLERVFMGLQLDHLERDRLVETLSGGEQTRLTLATLLLRAPDLLILDEPTNHLDFAALAWLEEYLAAYRQGLLMISHDRHFLNKVVSGIIELTPHDHQAVFYAGNYDFYLTERAKWEEKQWQAFEEQRQEIKELRSLIKAKTHATSKGKAAPDADKLAHNFRGERKEQSKGREIRAAKQQLNELLENPIQAMKRRWQMNPDFNLAELGSQDIIQLHQVSKYYGEQMVLAKVDQIICNGERVVLVAPNGAGKSTLLKIIIGQIEPDSGEVKIAGRAKLGYLDQNQDRLDLNKTVLAAYQAVIMGDEAELRGQLSRFGLFTGNQVFQTVGSLSIGQRRKLQLAQLMAAPANVLILDEPTNHLDLGSLEKFEQALLEFKGTILAVSHDRWFINRVATRVWEL